MDHWLHGRKIMNEWITWWRINHRVNYAQVTLITGWFDGLMDRWINGYVNVLLFGR